MPILEITSANAPKDTRDFVKRVSALFAECIGKPESYCVVTFNKVDSLFYNGTDEPGFIAKVGSIGHISNERNANLTKVITEALEKELGTINDRGYFMFTDFPAENIGYKHTTFANILNQ